jgi:hypothetical protein
MPKSSAMAFVRAHLLATLALVVAVAATGTVFAFFRPAHHPDVLPPPPDSGLSYTQVRYDTRAVQRAFARHGIQLVRRSRIGPMTDLSTRNLQVEVTVFGERAKVEAAGFHDYTTDASGHDVHFPASCANGARQMEKWRENVRVLTNCPAAGGIAAALAALP